MFDVVAEDVPRAAAQLRRFEPGDSLKPRYYWRIVKCPHCGSTQHEHGNYVTEAKIRDMLGEVIRAECHRKRRPRSYILVEAGSSDDRPGDNR